MCVPGLGFVSPFCDFAGGCRGDGSECPIRAPHRRRGYPRKSSLDVVRARVRPLCARLRPALLLPALPVVSRLLLRRGRKPGRACSRRPRAAHGVTPVESPGAAGRARKGAPSGGAVAATHFPVFRIHEFRRKTRHKKAKVDVFGGTRTHAPEETGALIQRLRPLGHEDDGYVH